MKPAAYAAWSEESPGTRAARSADWAPNGSCLRGPRASPSRQSRGGGWRSGGWRRLVGAVVDEVVDGSPVVASVAGVVVGPLEVVVEVVAGVVVEPAGSPVVLVPLLVVLVVVTGVGSVVPANAAPGRTRATPRVRARAAAGRALRMVRCMVPLNANGVATGAPAPERAKPPASQQRHRGAASDLVSGLRPAHLDGNGAASRSRCSGSPRFKCGLRLRVSAGVGPASPGCRVVVSPWGNVAHTTPQEGRLGPCTRALGHGPLDLGAQAVNRPSPGSLRKNGHGTTRHTRGAVTH